MLKAARQAADAVAQSTGGAPPLVIAVTVLSSVDESILHGEIGVTRAIEDQVLSMARLAQDNGLDGVVASAPEVARIREACGPSFVIMTPGISSGRSSDGRPEARDDPGGSDPGLDPPISASGAPLPR